MTASIRWLPPLRYTTTCRVLCPSNGSFFPSGFDNEWMGSYSGAAEIFCTTGGVMEAAIRTVHYVVSGEELQGVIHEPVRGYDNLREATVDLGDTGQVKVAVAHGLKAARQVMEAIAKLSRESRTIGFVDVAFERVDRCVADPWKNGAHQPRKDVS